MVIVTYGKREDKIAAELVNKRVQGSLIYAPNFFDINAFTDDVVVVGGQFVSPAYANYVSAGVLPAVPDDLVGHLFYGQHNGFRVWGVAGWLREGTIGSAGDVYLHGLPFSDKVVQGETNLSLVEIQLLPLSYGVPIDVALINVSVLASIASNLGLSAMGYSILGVSMTGENVIEILVRGSANSQGMRVQGGVMVEPLSATALTIISVAVAVIVLGVALMGYITVKNVLLGSVQAITSYKTCKDAQATCAANPSHPICSQVNKLCESVGVGSLFGSLETVAVVIAGAAVAVAFINLVKNKK